MKQLLFIIAILFSVQSFATHIIGGQIYYEPLGGTRIRLTVEIYRDGSNAQNAGFDRPLWVTVVGAGNARELVNLGFPEVTEIPFNDIECTELPGSVGYEKGVYSADIDLLNYALPDPQDGWLIVHRRCCFNDAARNVVAPDESGFALELRVPVSPTSNRSPIFNDNPPLRACLNTLNEIDASAFDPDGDSLVYSLCPALFSNDTYGTSRELSLPPYSTDVVNYTFPYSAQRPLRTNGPLDLNPNTGQLTFTPNDIAGNYVFSICVDEYRSGELIGSYQRVYQVQLQDCIDEVKIDEIGTLQNGTPCPDDFVTLFGSPDEGVPPYTYEWNIGGGSTSDPLNSENIEISFPAPGTYQVTLTVTDDIDCKTSDVAEIIVGENMVIDPLIDTVTCQGEPFQVIANSSINLDDVNFDWRANGFSLNGQANRNVLTLNGTNIGDYTVTVEGNSPFACNNPVSQSFFWQVKERNFATILENLPSEACIGDELNIIGEDNLNNSDYSWSVLEDPGSNLPNANNVDYIVSTSPITIILNVSNDEACNVASDTVVITSKEFVEADITMDTLYCFNSTVNAFPFTSQNVNYEWILNDTLNLIDFYNTAIDTIFNPGTYTLYLVADPGSDYCPGKNIDTVTFTVNDIAGEIDFSADQEKLYAGLGVTFTPNELFENSKFTWNLYNPDSTLASDSFNFLFTEKGEYQLCLSTIDEFGCTDSICKTIIVFEPPVARVPNAFTPDNDGYNDRLKILGIGIIELDFTVFNRWGDLMFQTSDPSQGWDGKYKGIDQPEEVYIYKFRAVLIDGKVINDQGNVTLLR